MHEKQIFILLFLWILIGITAKAQSDCEPGTGAVWGSETGNERGKSLAALPELDGFIVAGLKKDSVLLLKCDLEGVIEWTKTFDIVANKEEHVTAIFIDDEGMLAVAGIAGNQIWGGTTFVFRYDPVAHQILWAREYVSSPNNFCFSMISLGVGKNYVISNNPHYNAQNNNDAELIEIDKSNGNVVPSFSKNYSLGSSEEINQMTIHDGYIYGSGRYSDGPQPENMRNTLMKIDPTDGKHIWTRMGHIPSISSARLYGEGLVIDEGYIYATYQGDPSGTSTLNTKVFIQKSGLGGNIIWVKQYELPGPNEVSFGIIKSGNGFVVLAGNRSVPGVFFLFKVDENGTVLWANQYVFPSFITSVHLDRGVSQFIEAGDKLVFTGHGFNALGKTDLILVVADLNGEVHTACVESRPILVQTETINNPVFYQVEPSEFVFIPETRNVIAKSQNSSIALREECSIKDTLYTTIDMSICAGESFEGYTQAGTFIDEYTTQEGCDSIRTLQLSVIPLVVYAFSKEICVGDSFEGYSTSGQFLDYFVTSNGCDSQRILELTVLPSAVTAITQEICLGDTLEGYFTTGTYIDTFVTILGCDSIRILELNMVDEVHFQTHKVICPGSDFEGYSQSGIYTDTFPSLAGCDSIRVLTLLLEYPQISFVQEICSGQHYFGYSLPGIYMDTLVGNFGDCDTVRNIQLTVRPPIQSSFSMVLCDGDQYDGYTLEGVYTDSLITPEGCDSIREVRIHLASTTSAVVEASICDMIHPKYNHPGVYHDTLVSVNGCDSIQTTFIKGARIYIPNAFSPNGDDINDIFEINSYPEFAFELHSFSVYDRFGNKVFETAQWPVQWNGSYKSGQKANPGVFTYRLQYHCHDKEILQHGNITLLR